MSGDLMGRKYTHDPTKILEEACTLIELSNLVESYGRGHTKRHDRGINDSEVDSRKRRQRPIVDKEGGRGSTNDDGFAKLKLEDRRHPSHGHRTTLNDFAALSIRKSTDSKTSTSNLKRISKYKLQNQNFNKEKYKKNMNEGTDNNTRKRHRSTASRNTVRNLYDRKIIKQVLASTFDMANYMQVYPLKDPIKHDDFCKTPIMLLPKPITSKCTLKSRKSFGCFSDRLVLNKNSVKRDTYKLGKAFRINEADPRKSDVKKSSLHLCLNLRVKPDSNTLNLQIKSRKGKCNTNKPNLNTLSVRLPLQYAPTASQKLINEKVMNKLSASLSTTSVEKSAPSPLAQALKSQKLKILKEQEFAAPYAKTQAVYNMYETALMQRPREVKGMKSHLYFNINIGRKPQTTQRDMAQDDSSTIHLQPSVKRGSQLLYKSKVNVNSGLTSVQQSFILDRTNRQPQNDSESDVYTQSCRCTPDVYSGPQQSESVCSPCCQDVGKAQSQLPEDLIERYALLYHRTKKRILDRVGMSPEDARSMVFSPRVFMKKLYVKYKNITNKVEAQQKSVGSCTCSPFIETEEVSVQEDNIDPECSLLKRCFGQLIFSNKSVVCNANKKIGTSYRPLKPDECEPGECVEKSPGLFACFKKWCKRKEEDKDKLAKKAKEREKQKKAKSKAKKEKDKKRDKKRNRRKREKDKLKRKGGTGFLTSIFKKPDEDGDRQRLLNDEGKKRRKGDRDDKGKGGRVTEFEDKAKKTLAVGRRGYRRATRRIRERYYRNKKLAEEQKGRYACDFYLMSLRNKPCLWVYYLCPFFYPYCLQFLNAWRQVSDLLLFFVAIIVWSPCILSVELLKALACNMWVTY